MLKKIIEELRLNPGTKAAEIAKKLHTTRKDVNQVLYENKKIFAMKEDFTWALLTKKIVFGGECWLKTRELEVALQKAGCPTAAIENQIHFVFPKGCKILLESAARLMALSNQLVRSGKSVVLDFSDSPSTRTYLTRMGFYAHLDEHVEVLPKRPSANAATRYKGNNSNLVEFASIDPKVRDENLPDQLRNSFVSQTSERYFQAAFTVFAEFINNIGDHSKTTVAGFAALQAYSNASPPHIQTVISDSGVGIVANLRPILSQHYPEIAKIVDSQKDSDVILVKEVFQRGFISSIARDRGTGFAATGNMARRFDAKVFIRQDTFELLLQFRDGAVESFKYFTNLIRINGTHICLDFPLDDGVKPLKLQP